MRDIDRKIEAILDNHAIAYSRNTMKVIKSELPKSKVLELNEVDRQSKAELLALMNEARIDELYKMQDKQGTLCSIAGVLYLTERIAELKQGKTQ